MKRTACVVLIAVLTGLLCAGLPLTPAGAATPSPTARVTPTPSAVPLPPSGDWQITTRNATDVRLLNTTRGAMLGAVRQLAWSPDGQWLAAAGTGGALLIDAQTLQPTGELFSIAALQGFTFSADGRRLAGYGPDNTLQVWDSATRALLRVLPQAGTRATLSPDGKRIAGVEDNPALDADGNWIASKTEIRIFDVDTGKPVSRFTASTAPTWENPVPLETIGVYFSADGRVLQFVNNLGDVRSLDVASGRQLGLWTNNATRTRLSNGVCEADGMDGKTFAVVCMINYMDPPCVEETPGCNPVPRGRLDIGVWETSRLSRSISMVYLDPQIAFYRFLHDAAQRKVLMLDGAGGQIQRPTYSGTPAVQTLDSSWKELFQKLREKPRIVTIAVSPDGTRLAAGGGGVLGLVDLTSGKVMRTLESDSTILTSAALSVRDGLPMQASGYSDGSVVLSRPGGAVLQTLPRAHNSPVTQASFAGSDLFTLDSTGNLHQWSAGKTTPLRSYTTGYIALTFESGPRLMLNPTGGLLLLDEERPAESASVGAYTLTGGTRLYSIAARPDALSFSRDGNWLITAGAHAAAVYNARSGQYLRDFTLSGSGREISGAALAPDGSLLAAAVNGGVTLQLVNTHTVTAQIQAENFTATRVIFSPSGCLAAVGSLEGDILLADAATGRTLARLIGHNGEVKSLAFSDDGRLLLSMGSDHKALLWGQVNAHLAPAGAPAAQTCLLGSVPLTSTPTPTIPPVTPTPTHTPVTFTRNLYLTQPLMNGDDVLLMQQRLVELGYTGLGNPDGWFGNKTDEAVRLFQQRNGLEVDGVVGRMTWARLFSKDATRR